MSILSFPLILCGFTGSGKSAVGRSLANRLCIPCEDTDEILTKTFDMTIPEIFQKGGEPYFRSLEHEIVERLCLNPGRKAVIATGGGLMTIPCSAVLLARHGTVIHIHRDFKDCYDFLSTQKDRPLVSKRSRTELEELYQSRSACYRRYAALTIENDGTIEDAVNKILS